MKLSLTFTYDQALAVISCLQEQMMLKPTDDHQRVFNSIVSELYVRISKKTILPYENMKTMQVYEHHAIVLRSTLLNFQEFLLDDTRDSRPIIEMLDAYIVGHSKP